MRRQCWQMVVVIGWMRMEVLFHSKSLILIYQKQIISQDWMELVDGKCSWQLVLGKFSSWWLFFAILMSFLYILKLSVGVLHLANAFGSWCLANAGWSEFVAMRCRQENDPALLIPNLIYASVIFNACLPLSTITLHYITIHCIALHYITLWVILAACLSLPTITPAPACTYLSPPAKSQSHKTSSCCYFRILKCRFPVSYAPSKPA